MGLLCDYFIAPSDDAAAATIDWVGGPGRAAPKTSSLGRFRRLVGRESTSTDQGSYPSVDGSGIEPVVQLGQLEAILTGRDVDEVLESSDAGQLIAERGGGERLVVRLSAPLTGALAGAPADGVPGVAARWAQTEEFWGNADPNVLAEFLRELSGLARQARERGEALYCWVSI